MDMTKYKKRYFTKKINHISILFLSTISLKANSIESSIELLHKNKIDIAFIIIGISALFLYRQNLLKQANKQLQLAVDEKTKALQNINNNLERAMNEEIKKATSIEKRLYESEKLSSMSDMITNIAHQWRQPLSVISTSATGLLLQQEVHSINEENLKSSLNKINNQAQYLSKTIHDFESLLNTNTDLEILKLSNVISKCLSIQKITLNTDNIEVISNIDDSIVLNTIETELMQSLLNIINNAIDALKKQSIEEKYIFINTYKNNKKAIIEIYDNANGICEGILDKIFEAYFTTKHQAQGTGLSLNITYNTIKNSLNGDIKVENFTFNYNNNSYTGAKFTICLDLN